MRQDGCTCGHAETETHLPDCTVTPMLTREQVEATWHPGYPGYPLPADEPCDQFFKKSCAAHGVGARERAVVAAARAVIAGEVPMGRLMDALRSLDRMLG